MTGIPDFQIDQLRDIEGRSFGKPPVQGWLKPIRVDFHRPSLLDMMLGKPIPRDGGGPTDLRFVLHAPWSAPTPPTGYVRPNSRVFDDFLNLDTASDSVLCNFGARFGPLMVFCFAEATTDRKTEVIHERSDVWRYFARTMRALLHIAASIHAERKFDRADWDVIGNCPFPVFSAIERIKDETVLNPLLFQPEEGWSAMTFFIKEGEHRDRTAWANLLNGLLQLGRTRPYVVWDKRETVDRARMVFGGPRLLSYLALQLSLAALRLGTFATCSFCSRQYSPERAPKAGQRNYCTECRVAGVPTRMAQRDRRKRLHHSPSRKKQEGRVGI
jgi:hypothetical protein